MFFFIFLTFPSHSRFHTSFFFYFQWSILFILKYQLFNNPPTTSHFSAVDELIEKFKAVVEEGDILIDGGNEWFENTERRSKDLEAVGIRYLAVGVSGGEEGARKGPSIMPGGPRDAWDVIAPIFTKIAAQVDGNPCTAYLGKGGAGNYVKMVHNGIEYGDMQLIAEAYDILKHIAGMSNDELAATFAEWNRGKLQSYLIEITSLIFAKKDTDVYDSEGKQLEGDEAGKLNIDTVVGYFLCLFFSSTSHILSFPRIFSILNIQVLLLTLYIYFDCFKNIFFFSFHF